MLGATFALAACGGAPTPGVGAPSPTATATATGWPTTGSAAQTSSSAPSTSTTASATPEPPTISVVAGGDVLLHEPTWAQADADAGAVGDGLLDFTPTLAGIRPVVSVADLALCHLEVPLAADGGPYLGYPTFSAPPQIVDGLAATGFDACSVASNHTFDQGLAGVQRTVAQMRSGGVPTYGAAENDEPPNPSFVMVGEVKVGLLSYTYGSNAAVPPGGVVEMLDPDDIATDARAAREAGAQIVIASVHWGTEYDHEPNAQQQELAPQLAAISHLDLVIGHHAHVVQPIVQIDGTWVAFGLGNMLAAQATDVPANHEGVLARFTFTLRAGEWVVTEAGYLPTFIEREPTLRLLSLGTAMAGTQRYAEALVRTRAAVRGGAVSEGLVEIAQP